jgi:hypothetical protein
VWLWTLLYRTFLFKVDLVVDLNYLGVVVDSHTAVAHNVSIHIKGKLCVGRLTMRLKRISSVANHLKEENIEKIFSPLLKFKFIL